MRSALSFWKGKTCVATLVLLGMMAYLSLHKSNLCEAPPPEAEAPQEQIETSQAQMGVHQEEAPILIIAPEPDMQRALTEQAVILRAISDDVDSVNQSLGEIAEILQEQQRR